MRAIVRTGLGLVLFTQGLSLAAAEPSIESLIRQLGSSSFAERERAAKEIVTRGQKALEPLRLKGKREPVRAWRLVGQIP